VPSHEYYIAHRERYLQSRREYYAIHKEQENKERAASHHAYYMANREKIIANTQARYYANRTEILKKQSAYLEAHREHKREHQRDYYKTHREQTLEYQKRYAETHREQIREYSRRHNKTVRCDKELYARKKDCRLAYKVKRRARQAGNGGSCTAREWRNACDRWGNKCLRCGATERLTCDHVVPIKHGGRSDIGNLQLLCCSCNSIKSTKTIDYRPQGDRTNTTWQS
jgi:5-methylcytosine-specific restriction endonuclease McrA